MKLISHVEVQPPADLGGKNQAPAVTEMNPELVPIAHLSGIPHIRLVRTSIRKVRLDSKPERWILAANG
jgi:hypothetical protein